MLSAFCFGAKAQTDTVSVNTLINKTSKYLSSYPEERIYLHFDKPYYAVADTVWFKSYVTENLNLLSKLSRILYVDVINQKDSLIQTLKLPLVGGMGDGNFPLDQVNYAQGNYHVRAYTKWMLNFENPAFFNKTFYVGETIDKELKTHITYKNTSNEKDEKINARIQFKDLNDKPYANKTVTWQVVTTYTVVDKGKGVTDANGYLTISMSAKQNAEYQLKNGDLITSLEISDTDVAKKSFKLKNAIVSEDIQFFPEGGALVADIPNKIAFKAIKSDGLGIDANGSIVDENAKQVATFTTQHLGMGSFEFTPETGKAYSAKITFVNGGAKIVKLPVVSADGSVLNIDNSNPDQLVVKISSNKSFLDKNKGKKVYLVARSKGVICYGAQTSLAEPVYNTTIPKTKFPRGIAQFTLFSEDGKPISERIVFVDHKDNLALNVSTPLPSYGAKKKVKVSILAKNDTTAVQGSFSISVVDETKVPYNDDRASTILSTLLLTSDVKGYIEEPNYYFDKPDEKRAGNLDLLLLTQGYRSFTYADILGDKKPEIAFFPEQGIEVSGILRMSNGIPVRKGQLLLTIPDKRYRQELTTDPVGVFKFSDLVLNDTSKVTITAKYNAGYQNMVLSLKGNAFPNVGHNFNGPDEVLNIDSTLTAYLSNSKKQYSYLHTLKDVTISAASKPKPSHKDFSALTGLSQIADHEISGESLKGCNLLINCLQSMLPGVTFIDNNFYIARDYNAGNRIPMGIFYNGFFVDISSLGAASGDNVSSVEVFLKDQLGTVNRQNNINGVIVINQKEKPKGQRISKAQLLDMLPKNYQLIFSPQGYDKSRAFYVPRYDVTANLNRNDLRTTVYWNPSVVTDAAGKASFEFYNADGKGKYKVVVEGIDDNGDVARSVYRYIVK
ncbi:MAG: carboxypeptidase regulatory-like domain-containing protein [Pedobacter sp.]|nr:carboxypeptidase regulatory-like domain-containing protein [Pedobacter sp.]